MTEFCKHHLREPAHWECHNCNSFYCDSCIQKKPGGYSGKEIHYFCPSCSKPADWIAAANVVRPFWERLHTFFAYPFKHMPTLFFMLGIAFTAAVFSGPGFINGLVKLALFILLMKYSFTAMAATARGALIPPNVDLKSLSDDAHQAFVPAVLTGVIIFLCIVVAGKAGPAAGVLCLAFGFIALPSMIMSYMAGGSIIHALNPMLFISIMLRIGWPYLSMVFFLVLLLLAPNALGFALGRLLPAAGQNFLFSFANSYYTIIFYHLMGYVLLQFHQQIGYRIDQEDFVYKSESTSPVVPVPTDPVSGILTKIEFLAKEGKYDEALTLIKRETQGKITNPLLSRQYFKLLKLKNDPELAQHVAPHLNLVISQNDKKEACDVFLTSLTAKIDVNLPAQSLIKLAGWLNESGSYRESISVYNRIISGPTDNSLIPMAYFRAACILYEKLDNKVKADKIFRMLKAKYPMDDIIPHVDSYLRRIEATL